MRRDATAVTDHAPRRGALADAEQLPSSCRRTALVACHRLPERSFHWRGRQLPVCARCTGILVGWGAYPFLVLGLVELPLWAALALVVPALLDGLTQALGRRTSNNVLRVATGLLAGVGQAGMVAWAAAATARLLVAAVRG